MTALPELTLRGMIETNAAVRPHALAVRDGDSELSFGALARRARALAAGFAARGLRRQDRVAILSQNRLEYVEIYAACEWGGFIAATVNFRLAAPEILQVLQDSGPRLVIFEPRYAEQIEGLRTRLGDDVAYACLGDAPPWAEPFASLSGEGVLPSPATDEDIAYLIYTSGTTGKPKGCMIGQRGELEKARITAGDVRMSAQDRILLTMPLFHIGAKAMLNAQHWAGGAAVLHREFRPRAVLDAVQDQRITVLHLAPTMVQMLLEEPDISSFDLSSLRALVYSASAMPTAVLERGARLLGPVFYQIYGLTEGVGTILGPEHHRLDGDDRARKRLGSIGVPSPGVRLRIAREDAAEAAGREVGEIQLRTPAAACGYWNDSGATIELLRDGWLRTGDVGYVDDDGFVYLVDRKKDMIISGGENIYSREVEEALHQHPAVFEAAVIGTPDPKWGEAVCAVVALRAGAAITEAALVDHVRGLLASYKKPRRVVFVSALPKTANGKIDKQTIRRLYGQASADAGGA